MTTYPVARLYADVGNLVPAFDRLRQNLRELHLTRLQLKDIMWWVVHDDVSELRTELMYRLIDFYSPEIPYGILKARSGSMSCEEWIWRRLSEVIR